MTPLTPTSHPGAPRRAVSRLASRIVQTFARCSGLGQEASQREGQTGDLGNAASRRREGRAGAKVAII
jgi:hypothetical protein